MTDTINITTRNATPNIKILDAIMGAGKTTFIFKEIERQFLNGSGTKFLYVSPFLSEVGDPDAQDCNSKEQEKLRKGRIHQDCQCAGFLNPTRSPTKRESLKRLLAHGQNIACTHALYSMIDEETADLIEEQGYEVIIDEALEVIQPYQDIKLHDANFISDSIEVDPETHLVKWTSPIGDLSKYAKTKQMCEENRHYHYHRKFWIQEIPPSLLVRTKKTTICTYMFESSILHSYLLKHRIPFEYINNKSIGLGSESDLLAEAKELITIVDNPYVTKLSKYAMTSNGYKNISAPELDKIRGMLQMMVQRHLKAKSSELIWTCFNGQKKSLKGKGYARSFLACNARATNEYRKRSIGIYLVDRYPHTLMNQFLHGSGTAINSDLYGLSEMIQWVWRLRIREGKDIQLVIPSRRMKSLLVRWLNGEFVRRHFEQTAQLPQ